MKLLLERTNIQPEFTEGKLYIDGVPFSDTLEDTYRDLAKEKKIDGKTAIPCGIYRVIMTFSQRFQRILPEIVNVPQFTGVRIHSGNTVNDTEACPLVGKKSGMALLENSRAASDKLNDILIKENDIWIEIKII